MTEKERKILKKLVEHPSGLLSPADFINGIAEHDRRAVENLVTMGYVEEVPQDIKGIKLGTTYSLNFYRATEKGLTQFKPLYKKFWFNFKKEPALFVGVASIIFGLISSYTSIYTINNSINENKLKTQNTYLNYSPNYNEAIKFTPFESDVRIENQGKITLHNVQPEFVDVYVSPNTSIVQGMESMIYDLKPGDFSVISVPDNLKVKGKTIIIRECYIFNENPFEKIDNNLNPIKLREDPFYETLRRESAYHQYKCSSVFIKYDDNIKPIIIR